MSLKYAEERIKEALKLAGGNQARARKQIITWAFEDARLLQALTKHHLTGIAAYHIERVASGRAAKPKNAAPRPQKVQARKDDDFGMEILKAVANSDSAVFGLEGYTAPRKKGQASQQHIDAIRQMAARSKNKPPQK
ncbi:MAG: hypothetical protein KDJ35_01665 [Alphaproteobacteria bacterium]|nr:hypothetical protein [Alphaproteobacteria bacterium]